MQAVRLKNQPLFYPRRYSLSGSGRVLGQGVNRLLNISISSILLRRFLVNPSWGILGSKNIDSQIAGRYFPTMPGQKDGEVALLKEIQKNPSSEELADLANADAFFAQIPGHPIPAWQNKTIPSFGPCNTLPNDFSFTPSNGVLISLQFDYNDPFICPPASKIPIPPPERPYLWSDSAGYSFPPGPPSPRAILWNIELGNRWAGMTVETPDYIQNILKTEKVLSGYPLPTPFDYDGRYANILFRHIIPGLRALVSSPGEVNETIARISITMNILAEYQKMAEEAEKEIEDAAKRKQTKLIATSIALTVFGAALAAVGLPGVVAKGFSFLAKSFTQQQAAEFANGLQDAIGAFQNENPGFANEVKFASDVMDFINKNANDLSNQSAEDQNKMVQDAMLGIPTWIWIVGGTAILGTAAYFLLRK